MEQKEKRKKYQEIHSRKFLPNYKRIPNRQGTLLYKEMRWLDDFMTG